MHIEELRKRLFSNCEVSEKDKKINKQDKEFIEEIIKHRKKSYKDIILYIYTNTDNEDFINRINNLCKDYRNNHIEFSIYIYTPISSTSNFSKIDKTNDLKNQYEVDPNGMFSRCNIFHFNYDKKVYNDAIPKCDYLNILDSDSNTTLIEYFEKEYRSNEGN